MSLPHELNRWVSKRIEQYVKDKNGCAACWDIADMCYGWGQARYEELKKAEENYTRITVHNQKRDLPF